MRSKLPAITAVFVVALAATARAVIPASAPDLPVLGPETPRGHIVVRDLAARTPSAKPVDGAAADGSRLLFRVRTTGMTVVPGTAVLVLVDTAPGGSYPAPGQIRTGAEWAFLAAGSSILSATHAGSEVTCSGCEVATDATGFV